MDNTVTWWQRRWDPPPSHVINWRRSLNWRRERRTGGGRFRAVQLVVVHAETAAREFTVDSWVDGQNVSDSGASRSSRHLKSQRVDWRRSDDNQLRLRQQQTSRQVYLCIVCYQCWTFEKILFIACGCRVYFVLISWCIRLCWLIDSLSLIIRYCLSRVYVIFAFGVIDYWS